MLRKSRRVKERGRNVTLIRRTLSGQGCRGQMLLLPWGAPDATKSKVVLPYLPSRHTSLALWVFQSQEEEVGKSLTFDIQGLKCLVIRWLCHLCIIVTIGDVVMEHASQFLCQSPAFLWLSWGLCRLSGKSLSFTAMFRNQIRTFKTERGHLIQFIHET